MFLFRHFKKASGGQRVFNQIFRQPHKKIEDFSEYIQTLFHKFKLFEKSHLCHKKSLHFKRS